MGIVGQNERTTQNHVVKVFQEQLSRGNYPEIPDSSNGRVTLRYETTGLWVVFNFTSEKTPGKSSGKTPDKILQLLLNNENLKTLQEQGKLRRVGSAKGGHWKVLGG